MPYRPEVDGLRAVAVLSVVLFHAGVGGFSGGYVGVDVFFVISGYLITSILLTDLADGKLSLRHFYERRARRILPALLLVLTMSVPAAWLWLPPHALAEFGASVGYACAFVANLFFFEHSDYFDGEMALKPLAHTWSLAVEEQYYLAFPVLLLVLAKLPKFWARVILTAVAVASLLYAQGVVELAPQAAFYFLPSRIWELLLGALLAMHLREQAGDAGSTTAASWKGNLGGTFGLLMIAFAVLLYDAQTIFPGFSALLPAVGAALVICCARPDTWVGRMLALRPVVFVGLISYSTYLWHQPLLAILRHATSHAPGSLAFLAAAAASLILGYLSWRFVERPFRQSGRIGPRALVASLAIPTLALSLAGWTIYDRNGFEAYYFAHRASDAEKRIRTLQLARLAEPRGGERRSDDGGCRFRVDVVDEVFRRRFEDCATLHGPAVILLGDSHAMNIHNALHGAGFGEPFMVGLIKAGCRAEDQRAACPYAAFERFARQHQGQIRRVIYHQSGSYFIADSRGHVDSSAAFAQPGGYSLRIDRTEPAMHYLDRLADIVPTVWLGPFTEARVALTKPVGRDATLTMNPVSLEAFAALDQQLLHVSQTRQPKWRYVSMRELVLMDGKFLVQGDCLTFQDKDHLSSCGEELVGRPLADGLKPLL